MSEASAPPLQTFARSTLRAFVLVVGAFALVLLAPHAARALDTGPAADATEEVGAISSGSTEVVIDAVDDTVDTVAEAAGPATDAAESVNQAAAGAAESVNQAAAGANGTAAALDGVVSSVTEAVGQTAQIAVDAADQVVDDTMGVVTERLDETVDRAPYPIGGIARIVTETAADVAQAVSDAAAGLPGKPSAAQEPGAAADPDPPGLLSASAPWLPSWTQPTTARFGGVPSGPSAPVVSWPETPNDVPTMPSRAPMGGSSPPWGGSVETGGRGLSDAAFLVAASLLALVLSRWLRPTANARAPNPFLSPIDLPG